MAVSRRAGFPTEQKVRHGLFLGFRQKGERGHVTATRLEQLKNLRLLQFLSDVDQGRVGSRRVALAVDAMAGGADLVVDPAAGRQRGGVFGSGFDHRENPGHFVRIDVKDSALRVDRCAAPLGAAVEAGQNDRALSRWRQERHVRPHLDETFHHRPVRLGRNVRDQIG